MLNPTRIHTILLFLIFGARLLSDNQLAGQTIHWDVTRVFGVSTDNASPGTVLAIDSARKYFELNPYDTIVLNYPEGIFEFLGEYPSINFGDAFIPGVSSMLEFRGEGYNKTTFITVDRRADAIWGKDVYRVSFSGIHFTRDYCTVTQGDVVRVSPGIVVLELHEGFPTPDSLIQYGRRNSSGLYMKKYNDDRYDPHIIVEDNDQIPWDTANTIQLSDRIWQFGLLKDDKVAPYQKGDIIGVKLKHGGQAYYFSGGDNIAFDSCKWTWKTRGVLRGGISNIRFSNCLIDRGSEVGGRTPCLASPGGGPQCGQPNDPRITNVIIENCTIKSTGDDNCALFNVDGGIVRNCYFSDGFALGTRVTQSYQICLENNTYIRCSPGWVTGETGGDTASYCFDVDFESPDKPTNLSASEITPSSFTLSWSPSNDNTGISHYNIFLADRIIGNTSDTLYKINGLNSSVYYVFRVVAIDFAGNSSEFSKNFDITLPDEPLMAEESECSSISSSGISIYPNPSTNKQIFVEVSPELQGGKLSFFDLYGRNKLELPSSHKRSFIDISMLPKGPYILVVGNNKNIGSELLIVY
ncbi:MAG: fibronectin type III domain-containing protein [Bacteroidales bacterium]|nr:fibronectin type III domain-containing protein [Bacteroidales bacterium]MCF8389569.1 fibronectin type III domain-containing protein [Bacteroidales bacterium]